jgi:hypothetical protein
MKILKLEEMEAQCIEQGLLAVANVAGAGFDIAELRKIRREVAAARRERAARQSGLAEQALDDTFPMVLQRRRFGKSALLSEWEGLKGRVNRLRFLKERYLEFGKIQRGHNRRFMALMNTKGELRPKLFFDTENSILKELNDTVFDNQKNLATAVTNLHKEMFIERLEDFPFLKEHIVGRYSDFKSLRLAFDVDNPRVRRELQELMETVNADFSRVIGDADFKYFFGREEVRGIARSPNNWFTGGVGKSADEASLASRSSRGNFVEGKKNPFRLEDFEANREYFAAQLAEMERSRKSLERQILPGSGVLSRVPNLKGGEDALIPSPTVLEILRKTKPKGRDLNEYYATVRSQVKERFGVVLTDSAIRDLKSYYNATDSLSPSLFLEHRAVMDLKEAEFGVVSVDFAGQGADNLFQQMKALVGVKDPKEMVELARESEKSATLGLDAKKNQIEGLWSRLDPRANRRFSGDDGLMEPSKSLSDQQKYWLVKEVSRRSDPGKYRMTFLSAAEGQKFDVPVQLRAQIVARMEDMEKSLRRGLSAKGKFEQTRNLAIAIDIKPAKGVGRVGEKLDISDSKIRVIVGGLVDQQTTKAIQEVFKELALEAGIKHDDMMLTIVTP